MVSDVNYYMAHLLFLSFSRFENAGNQGHIQVLYFNLKCTVPYQSYYFSANANIVILWPQLSKILLIFLYQEYQLCEKNQNDKVPGD